jgi:hypothetical protein
MRLLQNCTISARRKGEVRGALGPDAAAVRCSMSLKGITALTTRPSSSMLSIKASRAA